MDLNADAGESYGRWTLGDDARLYPHLSSVNLALGAHAGDPGTLRRAVDLARQHGLGIGAHPGYPDLQGFGRRELALTPEEIHDLTLAQLGTLSAFLHLSGTPMQHVKAHGALYFRIHGDAHAGQAFCHAVQRFVPHAALMVLAGPAGETLAATAHASGLRVWREAFPERGYLASGLLAPRSLPGSSVHDPHEAADRAVQMARGTLTALDGTRIALHADTLCIHGDNPNAVQIAAAVRAALAAADVPVAPPA
ncbi:5-oxoprolinase subunit PxpA [Deinococcus aquiradiocola]|uniref:UPF0271 protein n=1 Tax=Deinococcus aquiradiocola TaxID=393059 RepID=A0A917URU1_9DEIO|nr:5-oxoprolinase subunit PxpA [Deinococcus aquiradiocola]GGJ80108.1 UPF0271 protein [Deinococcus aquiradiocola]